MNGEAQKAEQRIAAESYEDSAFPWTVSGDSAEDPPMIWDGRGDAIVSQIPDGRPYFERDVAEFIVRSCNRAALEEPHPPFQTKTCNRHVDCDKAEAELLVLNPGRKKVDASLSFHCHAEEKAEAPMLEAAIVKVVNAKMRAQAVPQESTRAAQRIGDIVTQIIGAWPDEVIMPTRPTIKRIVEAALAELREPRAPQIVKYAHFYMSDLNKIRMRAEEGHDINCNDFLYVMHGLLNKCHASEAPTGEPRAPEPPRESLVKELWSFFHTHYRAEVTKSEIAAILSRHRAAEPRAEAVPRCPKYLEELAVKRTDYLFSKHCQYASGDGDRTALRLTLSRGMLIHELKLFAESLAASPQAEPPQEGSLRWLGKLRFAMAMCDHRRPYAGIKGCIQDAITDLAPEGGEKGR